MRGIPVSRYVVHEHYDRRLVRNDIALLELLGRIRLGSKTAVTAACLPTPSSDRESLTGRHAVVTGWGTMSYGKTEQPGHEQAIDCTPHQFHFRGQHKQDPSGGLPGDSLAVGLRLQNRNRDRKRGREQTLRLQ